MTQQTEGNVYVETLSVIVPYLGSIILLLKSQDKRLPPSLTQLDKFHG